MDRIEISTYILTRLNEKKEVLTKQFKDSKSGIGYFYIDAVLPKDLAHKLYDVFPQKEAMTLKKSLREYKHVAAQMNNYDPLLEEVIYAFQDKKVVHLIGDICGIPELEPDSHLYAGGLSLMAKDNFLNPHLDNSHDKDRNRWRVLNLLYYVTPDWKNEYGGNLELWPDGLKKPQVTIPSTFNRLAVMATHNKSWHSVSPVTFDGSRCCVSNYYFSSKPLLDSDQFHVTSFRARPGDKIKDAILSLDSRLRMGVRKVFKKGIRENPHQYKS